MVTELIETSPPTPSPFHGEGDKGSGGDPSGRNRPTMLLLIGANIRMNVSV